MRDEPGTAEDRAEVLKTLYRWYKEEVFRRRELMTRLAAFAATVDVFLLMTLLVVPPRLHPDSTTALFAATGVALFAALFVFLILQQRDRHRMAKQILIELERRMGLFESGSDREGALYPETWQTDWRADRSVTVYVSFLAALAGLVIAGILVRL